MVYEYIKKTRVSEYIKEVGRESIMHRDDRFHDMMQNIENEVLSLIEEIYGEDI